MVLLLHGWGDRLESFNALLPELSKRYELIALDLPGFGQTQAPKQPWNLDDYAEFLEAFLAKLELNSVYGIIAHSNGGALAIRALSLNKISSNKLVLLASSGVRDTHKIRKAGLKVVAKTGKIATFWLPKSSKQKLQKKLYGTVGSEMLDNPPLQETFKLTVKQDIQRDATKVTIPTLLIYGDQDKATPLEAVGKQLNMRIINSHLKVIPGADHFVHQAASQEVSRDILEFLR